MNGRLGWCEKITHYWPVASATNGQYNAKVNQIDRRERDRACTQNNDSHTIVEIHLNTWNSVSQDSIKSTK